MQLTRTTVQYLNTQRRAGSITQVDSNIEVVESPDYLIWYGHNRENGETPRLWVEEKAMKSTIFEVLRLDDKWEVEQLKLEASVWLEQGSQELLAAEAKRSSQADLIVQLTRTTVQYFNTRLEQGEVIEAESGFIAAESSDYWVVSYDNLEAGEPLIVQVQEKGTNIPIFEMRWRDERWEAGLVKPEAAVWLKQASRELVAGPQRELQIQKPQMEL